MRNIFKIKPITGSAETLSFKFEFVRLFLTFALSLITYSIIFYLIGRFYHPDILTAIKHSVSIGYAPTGYCIKPKERLLFIVAIITFASTSILYYALLKNHLWKINPAIIRWFFLIVVLLNVGLISFIALKGFLNQNPFSNQCDYDLSAKTNFDYFFQTTFIATHLVWYVFLIFPIILFVFIIDHPFSAFVRNKIAMLIRVIMYSVVSLLIIIIFFISRFHFPYAPQNLGDFNAVYYSVVQVYRGIPMLVDNFTNTYGLYPHFLVPVLKIIGLSVVSFSSVMGFLISVSFAFIFMPHR